LDPLPAEVVVRRRLNLVTSKSDNANDILALELAYEVVDTVLQLLFQRLYRLDMPRPILIHHLLISTGLYAYFVAVDHKKDRAAWFTVFFVVMNYSTVCQNARWAIRGTNWERKRPLVVAAIDLSTFSIYALTRIGL
ncbi:MAG: hypothetical protein CYPHOPRED_004209, partial [Cyphobasidiales sp. Tagirdzhanova-0007]